MPSRDKDALSDYDALLTAAEADGSPWHDGRYIPNIDLLRRLLATRLGSKQQSGRTAKAFDAWVAHELRRAGFASEAVWPRTRRPRAFPAELAKLEEAIDGVVAAASAHRLPAPVRNAIRTLQRRHLGDPSTYILGDFYAKQVDVVISSWRRGPELLVSTKTMFSSHRKNLKNRHEEAVGEVSTLRRRHPMAVMGFAFLTRSTIYEQEGDYALLRDILTRLRRPGEMFDATLLLVAEWEDEDPAATLKPIEQPDPELGAGRFFGDMVDAFIDRTPIGEHQEVRTRRYGLPDRGGLPQEGSAEISEKEDDEW